jgi:hypothetical protein
MRMIETLHRLLPASAMTIDGISTMTADNVLNALDKQGVRYDLVRLGSKDWEIAASELTDDEILARLHVESAGHKGELIICTEACSRYGYEPFRCSATDLKRFVSEYDAENFFDGDVIIVCERSRTLTVFHHAGGYAHARL